MILQLINKQGNQVMMRARKCLTMESLINSQQQTYMNAFDLYIENVKLDYRGYFEIKWRRGRKAIQTLKYQSQGKATSIKETLTLNITLTTKNNRVTEKCTILDILDSKQDLIDSISLPIHRWTPDFTSLELDISKGVIKAKARRRQLMQIKVPATLASPLSQNVVNSDDEQYSQLLEEQISAQMMMSQAKITRSPIDSHRDEVTKLRKELEDSLYVNNKLKNDRSILMSRNIELETQISSFKNQVNSEIHRLEKYYANKMETHEAIYEEQINNIITTFNANSESNAKLLKDIMLENKKLEGEIDRLKSTHYLSLKQIEDHHSKALEFQLERQQLAKTLQQHLQQINMLREDAKNSKLELQVEINRLRQKLTYANQQSASLKDKINQLEAQNTKLSQEKVCAHKDLEQVKNELSQQLKRIQQMQELFEESRNELEFTEQAYRSQKQSGEINQEAYRKHITQLQKIIAQLESAGAMLQSEKQGKEKEIYQENDSLRKQIMRLRGEIERMNEEASSAKKRYQEQENSYLNRIQSLVKEVQQQKNYRESKLKQIELDQSKSLIQGQHALKQKNQQIQKLRAEVIQQRGQVQSLGKQVKQLKEINQKLTEELQFINENAIKVEEHDQLQSRVVELEAKLTEYEIHYQNVDFPSFEKEIGESDKKQKDKQQQKNMNLQNISFEGEAQKIKLLEQQLKDSHTQIGELSQENKEIRARLEEAIKQLGELESREQDLLKQLELAKVNEMRIIQYCESEDDSRKNQIFQQNFPIQPVAKTKQLATFAEESFQNRQHTNKQTKLKKSIGQMDHKIKAKKLSVAESPLASQKELSIEVEDKRWHNKNRFDSKFENSPEKKPRQSQMIRKSQHENNRAVGSKGNKKSEISEKVSDYRGQVNDVNRDGFSSRSVGSNEQSENRSRQSFLSGTTLYQFKRVTHQQKIKLLQKEVVDYKQFVEASKLRENNLLEEMQRANERVSEFERQLKLIEEDRHSLKATLHFQLEKKNNQRENRSSQTEEIDKQSKSVEVNIILEDTEKNNLQLQLIRIRKQNDEQVSKLEVKLLQQDRKNRNLQDKLDDEDKKVEQLSKKLQEKEGEVEKLRKQLRLGEQKDIEWKNLLHASKLEKKQVEFFLEKHEIENKKLKILVEEQQEKIRKNDIADAYRQLQYELDNANKKILDLNRQIYQAKLEKDTIDDEVKLLRKKNSDLGKKYTELEYLIESHEKNIEEHKRKDSRNRRQIESRQDANDKLREQVKKLNEEISTFKNLNNQQLFARKKYMDEIAGLQHSLERKQYELTSLRKQMERLKYMVQEKEEEKLEQKQNVRRQLQLLESEVSQKNKQIFELESSIKQMANQQEFSTAENRRNMNEKSGLYSEKLKVYIEEIAEIKKVLDENNLETNNLKYQLKEYEQEVLNLRALNSKLEDKLKDEANGNKQLVKILEEEHAKSESLKQKLQESTEEQYGMKNFIKNTKSELEQERKQHLLKKQQVEQALKASEVLKEQINKYKIKISEYETQLSINRNYSQKLNQCDKELRNTTKELREIKNSYEEYRRKFIHTPDELETALRNLQTKWKQKYEAMQDSLRQEVEVNASKNKKQLESEVLQLLSEVSNVRTESQNKSELISQLEFKITKMEILPLRVAEIEKLYNEKLEENKRLKLLESLNKQLRERIDKAENDAGHASQFQEKLTWKLQQSEDKIKSVQNTLQQINESYNIVKNENTSYANQIASLLQQEGALKSQVQNLLTSVRSLEEEKAIMLRKSQDSRKEHNEKISRLERKLEQMSNTVQEHEQALSSHYEANLEQIKNQLDKMYSQLQQKQKTIAQNYDLMGKLQYQLECEKKEVVKMKEKEATEAEIFEMEYSKMKNKMVEREKEQNQQIQELEQEVEDLSKQLTHTKLQNFNAIQPAKEESMNSVTLIRLEEKMKQKDAKIEELKRSTLVLEETIVKMKKKESTAGEYLQKNIKLEKQNSDYLNQIRRLQDQIKKVSAIQFNSSQSLKLEINSLKGANEKLRISLEEKQMEYELAGFELATLKELYGQLRKELQKRNAHNRQKADKQFQQVAQADRISLKINQLEEDLLQKTEIAKRFEQQLGKKDQMIVQLEEKISEQEKTAAKLKSISKLNNDGQHYKNEIKRLGQENEGLQKINKKLRQEMAVLEKDHYEAKTKLSLNQSSLDNLNTTVEEMSLKLRELEHNNKRFQDLNDSCFKIFRLSLDQAIFHGYLSRKIDEKDTEINNLLEEVEELKFLNERKLLDYDELRKQNYQLHLRLEDAEFAEEQVDELRQICDKLEQEKKDAIYRQQVLKVQMERILDSSNTELRERMDKVKSDQARKKVTNSHNRLTFS